MSEVDTELWLKLARELKGIATIIEKTIALSQKEQQTKKNPVN